MSSENADAKRVPSVQRISSKLFPEKNGNFTNPTLTSEDRQIKINFFVEELRRKKEFEDIKKEKARELSNTNKIVEANDTLRHIRPTTKVDSSKNNSSISMTNVAGNAKFSRPLVSSFSGANTGKEMDNAIIKNDKYPSLCSPNRSTSLKRTTTAIRNMDIKEESHQKFFSKAPDSSERKLKMNNIQKETKLRIQAVQQKQNEELLTRKEEEEQAEQKRLNEEKRSKISKAKSFSKRLETLTKEGLSAKELVKYNRAKSHYQKFLIVQRGFSPWRSYIELCRFNITKSALYRRDKLYRMAWLMWQSYLQLIHHERAMKLRKFTLLAIGHYRESLMRRVFQEWKLLRKVIRTKADAVRRHFSKYIGLKLALKAWKLSYQLQKRQVYLALKHASDYGDVRCKKRFFMRWLDFVEDRCIDRKAKKKVDSSWSKAHLLLYRP